MLTSYAQNFEDVTLMRALGHVEGGVYVDVGANDPVHDSISLAFYKRGWKGIHIEPVPEFASQLQKARPDERVIRAVVRDGNEPVMFYSVGNTGMSTGDAAIAAQHIKAGFEVSAILVESISLSAVLELVAGSDVHWLKIDVEGMEKDVLESWGNSSVRPWIVLIESTRPNSTQTTHQEWESLIDGLGYEFVYFDGLNRFYLSLEHPELRSAFEVPPNYFDDFTVTENSIFARGILTLMREKEAELIEASASIRSLEDQLAIEKSRITTDMSEATAEIEAQQQAGAQQIAIAEAAVAEHRNVIMALEAERDAQAVHVMELFGDLEAANEHILKAVTTREFEKHDIAELNSKLSLARSELTGLHARILILDEYCHEMERTIGDLREQNLNLMQVGESLQISEKETARLVSIIDRLEIDIGNYKSINFSLIKESTSISGLYREVQNSLEETRASKSWKITVPLRWAAAFLSYIISGLKSWLTLAPGVRPRRVARHLVKAAAVRVAARGWTKRIAQRLIAPLPTLERRLRAALRTEIALTVSPLPVVAWSPVLTTSRTYQSSNGEVDLRYVFVDHTVNCSTNTGVQRIVRGLAKELLDSGIRTHFVKWDRVTQACVLINLEERIYLGRWNGPPMSAEEAALYVAENEQKETLSVLKKRERWLIVPEVTHLSAHSEAITKNIIAWAREQELNVGFVFYDAIPLRRPEFAHIAPDHEAYMRELRLADSVWPISRWSADDLASFWRAGREMDNTHLPVIHPVQLPAEFDRPRVTRVAPEEDIILSVGTLEPRKNQVYLIRAFQEILKERGNCNWQLYLAGNLHPAVADEVRAATQLGSSIKFLGHVTDTELSQLYEKCAFTVFPSVEEGFGLPILESLWHAKPCICADFGAMGEVAAGGGCLRVDVRDTAVLKSALERLIDDANLRGLLAQEAIHRPITKWSNYVAELCVENANSDKVVYYWVDTTISFPGNTGIQRVARQLARSLIDAGFRLIPVKWGGAAQPFQSVSTEELMHFSNWNGPPADAWTDWAAPTAIGGRGWFIMTELPLNLSDAEQKMVRHLAESAGLRTAAVFYDTIPWKMREIYPEQFSLAHLAYMHELANYSLVLAISSYSRQELITVLEQEFHLSEADLTHVTACPLAGEFPEITTHYFGVDRQSIGCAIEILSVGTVEPRKNHERLIEAFELACERTTLPLRLTIVGGGHSIEPDLAVRVRGKVAANSLLSWEEKATDARINELYNSCNFTIYPSVEEGFGMPILESLWHGKPVICANFGAMLEVAAEGGGCLMVDVRNVESMANAMIDLANSSDLRNRLVEESKTHKFRSWRDYANDVAGKLDLWTYPNARSVRERLKAMGLVKRPKLSICISTYNRADWLSVSLRNIARLYPAAIDGVEFVICDNASTDHTPEIVRPFLLRPDFIYRRNLKNVGMLGNLQETCNAADGEYIWILGDDDLIEPESIQRVVNAIGSISDASLIYLNYAYSRVDDARKVMDFDKFLADATPIVPAESDLTGPIREICARNENFFTAIYALVLRRDHALRAYSQDTSGRPFSSMLTCIPTTYYVLNHMMDEVGVWIGEPQVVVNTNVSWMRYAPLWILERIPEVYELALEKGVTKDNIDRWRKHTLPSVAHFFAEIFLDDPLNNSAYFSAARLVSRFSDLPEFDFYRQGMIEIYSNAHNAGHPAASDPPSFIFGGAK